jgi:[NiFe] hydrogenase diaphorase moiety large subunit
MIKEKKLLLSNFKSGSALKKALKMKPLEIIEEIENSGLRGRGGAGFPTGRKWRFMAGEKKSPKYIVCNADEGEPGTFKDRELLLNHTNQLIEGMIIAGLSTSSNNGIIYIRGEYYFMRETIEKIIEEYKKLGFLGENILKSKFNFDISIRFGAGAYVCGEEFALIESLNGNRGEPRNKPPFPIQQGYRGKPTLVNNVETFCNVVHIIKNGSEKYAKLGVKGSCGTKLFSISGDIEKPGVYEFEFGITINDILKFTGAKNTKSVQMGGYSGINFSKKDFDKPISFDSMPANGAMIVFNENRDMFKVLTNIMAFFEEESCGQCTPCREGNFQLLKGLKMIRNKEVSVRYMKELKELCQVMKDSAKCGLGQSAPNPFLTILENFRDEILWGQK